MINLSKSELRLIAKKKESGSGYKNMSKDELTDAINIYTNQQKITKRIFLNQNEKRSKRRILLNQKEKRSKRAL